MLEISSVCKQRVLSVYKSAGLRITDSILKQIGIFTAKIAFVSKDQRVKLLMTIPGTDYFTALTIVSEIVDIKRFSTPWKLVAYAGLAPSKRDSGDAHRNGGHITK
jgi:transposase